MLVDLPQQAPGTRVSETRGFLPTAWIRNIAGELRSAGGWKLSGQMFAGIILAWTAVLGVMTYHSAHIVELKDGAERSYYQLVGDLAHSSSQVRIGATLRIPKIMLRRVPVKDNLGPIDSLKLTLGAEEDTVAAYHLNVQQIFRLYLANLNSRNPNWSLAEVQAAIQVLQDLGPEGWYETRETDRTAIPPTIALAWLWQSHHSETRSSESASTLFEGVKLDGIDFQGFNLTNADFQRASMRAANLQYAHLASSNLNDADLASADISSADLNFAQLARANLTGAYILSARSTSANFKNAILSKALLGQIDCSSCIFLQAKLNDASLWHANLRNSYLESATLTSAVLQGADLSGADMSSATLTSADFSNAILDSADLSYATATQTNFRNASVQGVDLKLTDLRGADFTGAKGLESVRDWTDANIADTRGLSTSVRANALSNGAVELPRDFQWKAYKQAGRPKHQWRHFLAS